jgi:hypothetical protein
MRTTIKLSVLFGSIMLLLVAAACDSDSRPAPSPVATSAPGPTVDPAEAGIMPARVVERSLGFLEYWVIPGLTPVPIRNVYPDQPEKPGIKFRIELTNNTGKDLKTYRGTLFFNDAKGELIETSGTIWVETPIKAGDKGIMTHWMVDTEFVSARKVLKAIPVSDLSVIFKPAYLTTADGKTEEAPTTP